MIGIGFCSAIGVPYGVGLAGGDVPVGVESGVSWKYGAGRCTFCARYVGGRSTLELAVELPAVKVGGVPVCR